MKPQIEDDKDDCFNIERLQHQNAELTKERDELRELSGQLFAVIQHAICMLNGGCKQSDFVLKMKGHHVFDCSYLIGQLSQLTSCEISKQKLSKLEANSIDKAVDLFYEKRGAYATEDEGTVTDFMRNIANQLREQAK